MGVPYVGTYTSDDNDQKIKIETTSDQQGLISGTYESTSSPAGALNISGIKGYYIWVRNKAQGRSGIAPFVVRFEAGQRPEGYPYALVDTWNGSYQTDHTMRLSGTRAYVNEDGEAKSVSLGTKVFSR